MVFKDPEAGPTSMHFRQTIVGGGEEADDRIGHYFVMGVCPNPRCHSATILYQVEVWEQHGGWGSDPYVQREEIIHPRGLPTELNELMHDVRGFGNIAGHPSQTSDGDLVVVDQVRSLAARDRNRAPREKSTMP